MRAFVAIGIGLVLAGCGLMSDQSGDPCAPVDVGGDCFEPSPEAFIAHALRSAGAWPQLDGHNLEADRVIEATELSNDSATWLVPLLSNGRMVAISRFTSVDESQVKLGEVSLLEEPLDPPPPAFGGDLVLFEDVACAEDPSIDCLFNEMRWAVRLPDGTFELPDGSLVEDLPSRAGSQDHRPRSRPSPGPTAMRA